MLYIFRLWLRELARKARTPTRSARRRAAGKTSPVYRPVFESLEDRTVPTTFFVTSTNDSGAGTLRQAITDANATANIGGTADVIQFIISGTGVRTISPTSALPTITEAVTIDGYSQTGASVNTLATGDNANLLIELSGAGIGAATNGLNITGSGSTVRGLVVNGFTSSAVSISGAGATGNVIAGNFIGTDPTGALGRANGSGVIITSANNTVGGTGAAARNVISGNAALGVQIIGASATGNTVAGNYIGTTAAGTGALPNTTGVSIEGGATGNTVGLAGAGNLISGNTSLGVLIAGAGTNGTVAQANFIGTNALGTGGVGNGTWGIIILSGASTRVGGDATAGLGNVISGNSQGGVAVFGAGANATKIQGNVIGLTAAGTTALGNGYSGVYTGSGSGFSVSGYSTAGSATYTLVGGPTGTPGTGLGNVVSASGNYGVWVTGSGATGTSIQGNLIGLNAAGTAARGNALSGVEIDGGAGGNTVDGTAPLTVNGTGTYSGVIKNGSTANTALTVAGGSVTLSGANTYTGPITVTGGVLQISFGTTIGSISASTAVTNNATFRISRSDSVTFANGITGTGTVQLFSTGGAVSQTAPIVASTLTATAATGVTLTNAGNAVGTFSATNGAISMTNSAALTVSGISQTGGGAVTVSAATGTLNVSGAVNTGNGNLSLSSGDAVALGANVNAGSGTITIAANTDGTGTQGYDQGGATLTTTNNTTAAVSITVNTAGGGTGSAIIGMGTVGGDAGGKVTVNSNGGSVLWSSNTVYTAFGTAQQGTAGGSSNTQVLRAREYSFTATGTGSVGGTARPLQTDNWGPDGAAAGPVNLSGSAGTGGFFVVGWDQTSTHDLTIGTVTATGTGAIRVAAANATGHNLWVTAPVTTGSGASSCTPMMTCT